MNSRPKAPRFIIIGAATASLLLGLAVAPAANASSVNTSVSASSGIAAKKKVLTTEQKKALAALEKAAKDLKAKEKTLASAIKAQAKAAKALAKAEKAVKTAKARAAKKPTKKNKAAVKAALAELAKAQANQVATSSLVAQRSVTRDITQAKVIRADAKFAWLNNDISTLQCGVGSTVTTASGAVETVRECGIVYMHEDGDTTHVKTTSNQLIEVRNIGLQTPERKKGAFPAQCGSEQAYQNFVGLMPEEITIVQLRSIADSTNGWGGGSRPERSVYKLNNATGQFDIDVQAEQIKAGWSLWWPLATEWAHNKEYLDLMNDAKARGVGLWNPSLCGAVTGGVPSMWFSNNAPDIDANTEPAFGEYVILKNETTAAMDLTNWSLRDNSLNFFWSDSNGWMQSSNKFGSLVLKPGEHKIIYLDNPDGYSLSSTEYEYFNWTRNTPGPQLTNSSINGNYANGDGLYLQDPQGNIRASMTNPCTSSQLCVTPTWVAEIISSTRKGQIIPIPVALNKVANTTRDRYNPVVSIATGATATATKASLVTAGFTAADGNSYNSPYAAGVALAITDDGTYTGTNSVVGQRRGIADLLGQTRTTLYVHAASGYNAVPNVVGLSASAARAALVAAGFTGTTVTGDAAALVTLQSIAAGTSTLLGTQVSLTAPLG